MNKILVLGTGSAQKDIIEYCKNAGYYVIATSNVSGYSAQYIADEFYQVDITDAKATEELARKLEVDLLYSVGSDVAMPTVAGVSEKLELPCFITKETAIICNHKELLRKRLNNRKVDGNIPYQTIEDVNENIRVSFPAIMKPSDSQGQRGVRRVECAEEIRTHFDETISFSREKKVILESFIDGSEISVNVFIRNGELTFFLISDRIVWEEYPGGLIKEHVIPSKYEQDKDVVQRIEKLVLDVLDAIKLTDGPAYFQIKVDCNGEPYLIEVTPRLDGCHMWKAIYHSTGVDLLKATMETLVGNEYIFPSELNIKSYSLEFLCGKPGDVFYERNYKIPDNEYLYWYYEDGQKINRMNGYYEKCGYVIKKRLGS